MAAVTQQILAASGRTAVVVADGSGTRIGDMTGGGGLPAAFDGNTNQGAAAGAIKLVATDAYVGKTWAAKKAIQQGQIWSANDVGFHGSVGVTIECILRAKTGTAPSSPSDGTSLGTSGTFSNVASLQTKIVASTDQTTLWDHTWWEVTAGSAGSICVAEARFTELI